MVRLAAGVRVTMAIIAGCQLTAVRYVGCACPVRRHAGSHSGMLNAAAVQPSVRRDHHATERHSFQVHSSVVALLLVLERSSGGRIGRATPPNLRVSDPLRGFLNGKP